MLLDPNSQISLDIYLREENAPVYIYADAGLMRQVITNLTKNSVENMQDNNTGDPKLNSRCELLKKERNLKCVIMALAFLIQDTSPVSEPYVTTREKGTGLGLAIVQKIISDHSGEIRLDNHPELGAVVTLSIPLAGGEK